mmetsp:Transcript_30283/g.59251  ORF Transcript_30283/g.59251 Transcript_30283/m.59251 type:complete len:158 (-) Transcript_30283:364-837(-)|eukprot:CAMPEP_0175088782 /NCGR_PEP_ID=MMETSP0086_2-20121207/433_1 /TAXON_ID=136419 /ORGANISM="Unknown Unknown, Strain D1" /LENGTH=157 /DNA_ID=CAMNT_0016361241 /DNA_START=27 /DNA_END=500 /DNA_ORIENTATION=+
MSGMSSRFALVRGAGKRWRAPQIKGAPPHKGPRPRPITQEKAKNGLFANVHIGFGDKVSHSERKTRRSWKPNVHKHNFYSLVMKKTYRLDASTTALRWMDKYGGFDNYILKVAPHKLGPADCIAHRIRAEMNEKLKSEAALAKSEGTTPAKLVDTTA